MGLEHRCKSVDACFLQVYVLHNQDQTAVICYRSYKHRTKVCFVYVDISNPCLVSDDQTQNEQCLDIAKHHRVNQESKSVNTV